MSSDVFRFVAVSAAQRMSDSELEATTIKAYGPAGMERPLHQNLREHRASGRTADLVARVDEFIRSDDFFKHLSDLATPLDGLDAWLSAQGDRAAPQAIVEEVKDRAGQEPSSLVGDAESYLPDCQRTADSLLSVAISKRPPEGSRGTLMRAMRLFGLVERLARHRERVATEDDVHDALADAIVLLPSDVFARTEGLASVGAPSPETQPPAENGDGDEEAPDPVEDLRAIRGAIDELRMALRAHAPSVGASSTPVSDVEVAPRVEGSASVGATRPETPPRAVDVDEDGEARVTAGVVSRAALQPLVLPRAVVSDLSPATRSALAAVMTEEEPVDVPEAIARLEMRTAQLRTLAQGNGNTQRSKPASFYADARGAMVGGAVIIPPDYSNLYR